MTWRARRTVALKSLRRVDGDGVTIDREELLVEFRYLHNDQVMAMLDEAGLRLVEKFGDFDGSPITGESEEMIYVCRLV